MTSAPTARRLILFPVIVLASTAADHAPGFSFQGDHRRAIVPKIRPLSCTMAFIIYTQSALSQFHNLPKSSIFNNLLKNNLLI
jgi:hypothetical protein